MVWCFKLREQDTSRVYKKQTNKKATGTGSLINNTSNNKYLKLQATLQSAKQGWASFSQIYSAILYCKSEYQDIPL